MRETSRKTRSYFQLRLGTLLLLCFITLLAVWSRQSILWLLRFPPFGTEDLDLEFDPEAFVGDNFVGTWDDRPNQYAIRQWWHHFYKVAGTAGVITTTIAIKIYLHHSKRLHRLKTMQIARQCPP